MRIMHIFRNLKILNYIFFKAYRHIPNKIEKGWFSRAILFFCLDMLLN